MFQVCSFGKDFITNKYPKWVGAFALQIYCQTKNILLNISEKWFSWHVRKVIWKCLDGWRRAQALNSSFNIFASFLMVRDFFFFWKGGGVLAASRKIWAIFLDCYTSKMFWNPLSEKLNPFLKIGMKKIIKIKLSVKKN